MKEVALVVDRNTEVLIAKEEEGEDGDGEREVSVLVLVAATGLGVDDGALLLYGTDVEEEGDNDVERLNDR
jgi:hypothetical protein